MLPGAKANQIDIHPEGHELIIAGTRPLPACCAEGDPQSGRFREAVLVPVEFASRNTIYHRGDVFPDGLLIIDNETVDKLWPNIR